MSISRPRRSTIGASGMPPSGPSNSEFVQQVAEANASGVMLPADVDMRRTMSGASDGFAGAPGENEGKKAMAIFVCGYVNVDLILLSMSCLTLFAFYVVLQAWLRRSWIC